MSFHDNEATVTPPATNDASDTDDAPETHSQELTKTTAQYVHDLLKDEGDEGDFDVYDKIQAGGSKNSNMWFKVIHTDTELAYRVIIEPIDD